jgi:hypothetical protein
MMVKSVNNGGSVASTPAYVPGVINGRTAILV